MSNRALVACLAALVGLSVSGCGGPDVSSDPAPTASSENEVSAQASPVRDYWMAALGGSAPDVRSPGCVIGPSGGELILNTGLAVSGTNSYLQKQGLMVLRCSLPSSSFLLPVLTVSDDDGVALFSHKPDVARMGQYVEDMLAHARNLRVMVDGRLLDPVRSGMSLFGARTRAGKVLGVADGLFVRVPGLSSGMHVIEVQAQVASYHSDTRMMLDVH